MKKLDKTIKKYGLIHVQAKESPAGYIYEVFSDGAHSGYDVFQKKVRVGADTEIKGRKFKTATGERYPNDKAFGAWAWHTRTLEKAEARLSEFNREK
jgi:hypothetical protein